jgi:acetyl esterase/lipase
VTVLEWLHAQAADLGVDGAKLAIGGTSAGAALAAGAALRTRDQAGPSLACLLLVCPVTDDRLTAASIRKFWDVPGWNGAATSLMWRHYLPTDGKPAPYAAPNRAASLRGLPRTHLVVADLDPLRDEGLDLARRLADAGVPTTLHHYPHVPHGFDTLLPEEAVSRRSVDNQIRALVDLARAGHDDTAQHLTALEGIER